METGKGGNAVNEKNRLKILVGVLCVVFGVYKTVMEFLADPFRRFKTHFPKLLPYGIGLIVGFMGVAKLLAFLLDKYPAPSVCVFI